MAGMTGPPPALGIALALWSQEKTEMKNFVTLLSVFAIAGICISTANAERDAHFIVNPDEVVWKDLPSLPPGAKFVVIEGKLNEPGPFTFRVKFPPNFEIPAHFHPAIEYVTVLSGTFNIGEGDKLDRSKTRAVPTGGFRSLPRAIITSPGRGR
jgi:hypothetical protein